MSTKFIGRVEEQRILQKAFDSEEAEMVAIIGRRRVGKTFLINEVYGEKINFEVTGIQHAPREEQIKNFMFQLKRSMDLPIDIPAPSSWLDAFILLISYLEKIDSKSKKVVFLDELSWLSTPNSGFLRALGFFWNSWAVKQNIVVVICGSAASWMIKRVVNHKGGLHNRITQRIFLRPFTLKETREYLKAKRVNFTAQQLVELYMAIGGIPHYLKEIEPGLSVVQNIDKLCFSPNGFLQDEFSRLYPSLFENAERHEAVVRALAKTHYGMTRIDLVAKAKLADGGNVTQILEELEQSGFIASFYAFGKKKKGKLYRLSDEYSLFYLRFIEGRKKEGPGTWQHYSQTQSYKIWSGYAFENVCLQHIPQIKKALEIGGVYSETSSFYKKGTGKEKGTQIDLLLDRNDNVINVFEIKFHNTEISITEAYAKSLRERLRIFQEFTHTRKYLMLTIISIFGVKENKYSLGFVEQSLTVEDLFNH